MIVVRAIYHNGEIKPIEAMPDVKTADVLIVFPNAPVRPPDNDFEARLFGSGEDGWTDELDAAVRESLNLTSRSSDVFPAEDPDDTI